MTVATGTATSYADLLTRFITFVTGLGDGQAWTVLGDVTEDIERVVYLRAPGLAGADQIYMSIDQRKDIGLDIFNLGFRGYTGYIGGNFRSLQPGFPLNTVAMLLWNTAIPYWFIANGRCAKIIAKVTTNYQQAYMGFITPYASPTEYQYPLFVGAMCYDPTARYSDTNPRHSAFWSPTNNVNTVVGIQSAALLRTPGGQWWPFQNRDNQVSGSSYFNGGSQIFPDCGGTANALQFGKNFDAASGYSLIPFILHSSNGPATYGELDGVFSVSGFSNAAESIITIAGEDYLVVQNAFRSGIANFAAYRLV